jgi:hypothetical protein
VDEGWKAGGNGGGAGPVGGGAAGAGGMKEVVVDGCGRCGGKCGLGAPGYGEDGTLGGGGGGG